MFPDITNLPADPALWRFDRMDEGGPFGVTVFASIGKGDMAFSFEVNSRDPSCEQAARDHGFPEPIIDAALKVLRPPGVA